jgi:hypothetical protein
MGLLIRVLCLLLPWGVVAPAAAGPRTPAEIVAEVRHHTARYLDIARAREDGFVQISGMEPRHGYHFLNASSPLLSTVYDAVSGGIDLARPPMLLYVERDGQWQLAGVEYALPRKPDVNPLPGADWHEHEASCHYRDYRELPGPSARDCPPTHPVSGERFVLWHPALAVENAFLAPYGGAASEKPGHSHARNPAEALYSQMTHRTSGALLVVLAAVIFWEGWRARRFPLNAISAAIWIAFGVYLFVTADPEAWPSGPKRFVEIFGDLSVLQHKLYALLLVTIGVIAGLRAYGTLNGRHARYLVPLVGALGGISLFVHLHDGSFHLNAIYLQHAAMGVIAVGLGATLWLTRRTHAERILKWAWPSFIILMGAVLLFYVER